jgi:hypothetical protein
MAVKKKRGERLTGKRYLTYVAWSKGLLPDYQPEPLDTLALMQGW